MKHLLLPRVWIALLAGLAVGCILFTLPLESPRQTLPGWQASWGLHYSPDSRRLVTVHIATGTDLAARGQGAARLWDAATGELIAELEQERDPLASVVFSPDSKHVAASNEKGEIKLWDADTGWPLGSYRMKGFDEWRSAAELAFAADGRLLMREPTGTRMWDVQTGNETLDLATALGKWKVRTYGGSTGVLIVSDGATVRAIRSGTGERIAEFTLPEPELTVQHYALTPDGQVLLARLGQPSDPDNPDPGMILDPGLPYLWSRPDAPARRFPQLANAKDFVLAPDGSAVAAHFSDAPNRWIDWLLRRGDTLKHSIRILDLATGRETGVVPNGLHACFAPDGRTLAVGCVGGAIELWDYPLRKAWAKIISGSAVSAGLVWLLLGWLGRERHGKSMVSTARAPLAILGVLLSVGPAVAQAGPQTGKPERVDRFGDALPRHALFRIGTARLHLGEGVGAIAVSPDGKVVSAVGVSGIWFWDTATGRSLRHYRGAYGPSPTVLLFGPVKNSLIVNEGDRLSIVDFYRFELTKRLDTLVDLAVLAPDGKTLTTTYVYGDPCSLRVRRRDLTSDKSQSECQEDLPQLPGKTDKKSVAVAVSLSPNGQLLAVREFDRESKKQLVRVLDSATGDDRHRWTVAGAKLTHVALSPDAKHLAGRGDDGSMCVWEVATGKELSRWKVDDGGDDEYSWVRVSFAPDGASLFWRGPIGVVRWDWRAGKPLRTYPGTLGPPTFFPGGKVMAVRGSHYSIALFDVDSGKDLCPLPRHGDYLAFSPDGRHVAWSEGDAIVLADATSGAEVRRWQAHIPTVGPLEFSPDAQTLASTGADQRIRWWEVPAGREIRSIAPKTMATRLSFSSDGRRLVSGHAGSYLDGQGSSIGLWDVATGASRGHWHGDQSAAIAPDLKTVAIADSKARHIRLLDAATGKTKYTLPDCRDWVRYGYNVPNGGSVGVGTVFRPRFSPDGRLLLTGGEAVQADDGDAVYVWDVATGKRQAVLAGREVMLSHIAIAPDGLLMALMRSDCKMYLCNTATGAVVRPLGPGNDAMTATPVFTPDGRTVVTVWSGLIQMWEVATGDEICQRHTFAGAIERLSVSPDGRRLAASAANGTMHVIDLTRLQRDEAPAAVAPLEAMWADLAHPSAARARLAIEGLIAAPVKALPLLRQHLKPLPVPDPKRLARWVVDLESDVFELRQEADEGLERLGERAGPALRKAMAGNVTLEARRRIERLLAKLVPPAVMFGEPLRTLRAVQVLEGMGDAGALRLLQELAQGGAGALVTDEATAAVARLMQRAKSAQKP